MKKGQNHLIRMAFCGTAYSGFQVQKNAPTVCAALQDALQAVYGARPDVKGCSRTDAGVHARDFCVSFFAPGHISTEKLPLALNGNLPADIRVFSARHVPEDFHARYSALGKEYVYHIRNSAVADAFCPHLAHRVTGPIDEGRMQQAGQELVGRHDFAAFMSSGSDVQDTVRTVTRLEVARRGEEVLITIAADGFLYNMVRIIAGTLLLAGRGKLPPEDVRAILQGKNRGAAGDTLPPQGLFLNRVFYPENI